MERWIDIQGYEGKYQVSDTGKIKSLKRIKNMPTGGIVILPELIVRQKINRGYAYVTLSKKSIVKTFKVHRLVAMHFIANPENKAQVNHKDCNKSNNNFSNLEWATPFENMKHAFDNNLISMPDITKERNGRSKLTELQVSEIRNSVGFTNTALAKKYNVSKVLIGKIINNKLWKN